MSCELLKEQIYYIFFYVLVSQMANICEKTVKTDIHII